MLGGFYFSPWRTWQGALDSLNEQLKWEYCNDTQGHQWHYYDANGEYFCQNCGMELND